MWTILFCLLATSAFAADEALYRIFPQRTSKEAAVVGAFPPDALWIHHMNAFPVSVLLVAKIRAHLLFF
jgi:hypothetical protein